MWVNWGLCGKGVYKEDVIVWVSVRGVTGFGESRKATRRTAVDLHLGLDPRW